MPTATSSATSSIATTGEIPCKRRRISSPVEGNAEKKGRTVEPAAARAALFLLRRRCRFLSSLLDPLVPLLDVDESPSLERR